MDNIELVLKRFAAKSCPDDRAKWLPFYVHSTDTAGIAQKLIKQWAPDSVRGILLEDTRFPVGTEKSEERAASLCRLVALLHDIGKLTPAFQCNIAPHIESYTEILGGLGFSLARSPDTGASSHPVAGQAILHMYGFPAEISGIVGSHHGRPHKRFKRQISDYPANYYGKPQNKNWQALWEEWIRYSLRVCGFDSAENVPLPGVRAQMIITAVLIMSDWIASSTGYFPLIGIDETGADCSERVKTAFRKIGLTFPAAFGSFDERLFTERFGFEPNGFQRGVINTVSGTDDPGILILEAPMGQGKTEAALAAAEILAFKCGAGGVFFGLPTQATANGIFARIKSWAENRFDGDTHSIRLAHGAIELNDEYQSIFHGTSNDSEDGSVIIHEWFEGRKQALLSDYVIATVDQFLLASLKHKHVMLRHLGLAGKIVIIDECHAYDAYMNVYLDNTLRWMSAYGVPVIILSATLPPERRAQLISAYTGREPEPDSSPSAYPVITWTDGEKTLQRAVNAEGGQKRIGIIHINESDLTVQLNERLSQGGCAGIIVNTVSFAQQLAKRLAGEMSGYNVVCFHSRFVQTDRAETEKRILEMAGKASTPETRDKLIVVGTQVIEQSLDIDFDFMVSEICPVDLLLQRAGRLHRHRRSRPAPSGSPVLAVMEPTDKKQTENTCALYTEWLIHETQRRLPDSFVIPDCIPGLVGEVYRTPSKDSTEYYAEWQEYDLKIRKKRRNAEVFCISSGEIYDSDTIAELIDDDKGSSPEAEASVRDAGECIEVLALKRCSERCLRAVSQLDMQELDTTCTPDADAARRISSQRLRLPEYLSGRFNDAIKALDNMPKMWRTSGWLKNELLLIFDDNNEAEMPGCRLRYDSIYGLEYGKGE